MRPPTGFYSITWIVNRAWSNALKDGIQALFKQEILSMGRRPTREEYDTVYAKWDGALTAMQSDPQIHWLRPRYRKLYMPMWAELLISFNPHHGGATKALLEVLQDEEDGDSSASGPAREDVGRPDGLHEDLPPSSGE